MASYAHPEMLVSTAWVVQHRHDPQVRIVESDEDVLLYDVGHIPGAIKVDWHTELQHQVVRDYVDKDAFATLVGGKGIGHDHTVVFYGDRNNWWACYALWVFKMYGHRDCRIMNGGRQKWIEEGRELTAERPAYPAVTYRASGPDLTIRAFQAVIPDGTFKSVEQLQELYEGKARLKPTDDVIAYCRIGERSSHTWFVLRYLLGYPRVRNYDGSWTEWGNLVGVPIEKAV